MLSPLETEILINGIALLASPATCEPLAVLTRAAKNLCIDDLTANQAVSKIHKLEKNFSANGSLWNNASYRAASLGAVLRFHGTSAV